jgi:hypothetical protein
MQYTTISTLKQYQQICFFLGCYYRVVGTSVRRTVCLHLLDVCIYPLRRRGVRRTGWMYAFPVGEGQDGAKTRNAVIEPAEMSYKCNPCGIYRCCISSPPSEGCPKDGVVSTFGRFLASGSGLLASGGRLLATFPEN